MSSSQLTNSIIFQRAGELNHQPGYIISWMSGLESPDPGSPGISWALLGSLDPPGMMGQILAYLACSFGMFDPMIYLYDNVPCGLCLKKWWESYGNIWLLNFDNVRTRAGFWRKACLPFICRYLTFAAQMIKDWIARNCMILWFPQSLSLWRGLPRDALHFAAALRPAWTRRNHFECHQLWTSKRLMHSQQNQWMHEHLNEIN